MRIYALELNNDIRGLEERKAYIEGLFEKLDKPDLVVLPELSLCGYIPNQELWKLTDNLGEYTSKWAVEIANKYHTYLGVGFIDKEAGDYYNRYLIAGPNGVCGIVTKSQAESAVFKRGKFPNLIKTPFGNVAVGICYDSRRKLFYDNIKDEELSLILFPHASPADPTRPEIEIKHVEYICNVYSEAFNVPVVYVNSVGKLDYLPGKMGSLMAMTGFKLNGRSRIAGPGVEAIETVLPEVFGADVQLNPQKRQKDIKFHGNDLIKGNWLFRVMILRPDVKNGIRLYEQNKNK